ncbi:E3 ubiquitin-protein ligase TRIM45-like [Saccostrea cucullata]|uniref:E3 ubiquitin-protein ligase TRIM45-like n=1 Tax=Saccostrea cuccullata TaxID=36930 RepID=UPI002ED0DE88
MATSSTERVVEDVTLCSICVEKFKTPRCLPCMHSFCHKCLTSYIDSICKSTEPRLGFNCPLCLEYVPRNGAFDKPEEWAANFPVNYVLDKILETPEKRLCAACQRDNETENASDICLSCNEYLCTVCTKHHRKHLPSKDHIIIQLKEVESKKITHEFGKYFRCPEHNEVIKLFCSEHDQPCCILCTGTTHRKCDSVDTIQNAALNIKEGGKLDVLSIEVRHIENRLADAMQEQKKNTTELDDSVDEMTKQSEINFKELLEHIEKLKNKHLDEIAVAQKRGREEMDRVTNTLKDGINCANYCSRNIEKAR